MGAMLITVLIISLIIFAAVIIGIYQKITNAICLSTKSIDGKTVIVTGGTAGIGLEIALDLARRGARIIIACPFEDEGAHARKHIVQQSGNDNVVFKYLDLGSLASLRKFASDILTTENRLDILINNAGVGIPDDFITKDGMHFIMQVNYFGTFLLTLLLLPLLKKSGQPLEPSRIVNTTSILHWLGTVDFNNLNTIVKSWYLVWGLIKIYGNSKLCLALFTHELAKRLKGSNVVVNCVDPGAVATKIFQSRSKVIGSVIIFLFYYLFKTPQQGAQTSLHVALDTKAGKVSGQLFKNCQLSKARALANDDKTAKKLWIDTVQLVQLSNHELDFLFTL